MRKIDLKEYYALFTAHQAEALRIAHDVRKFEIELYWKRAAYFWTFIAAAFGGYFALQKEGEFGSVYVITCLGFIFSLGWYYVNRGSGAWQRNWEKHVDLLEDDITGPLYKTLIDKKIYRFWDLASPYSFSPSRINNLLSVSVTVVWLFLMARTFWKANLPFHSATAVVMTIFTIVVASFLTWQGRASYLRNIPIERPDIEVRPTR